MDLRAFKNSSVTNAGGGLLKALSDCLHPAKPLANLCQQIQNLHNFICINNKKYGTHMYYLGYTILHFDCKEYVCVYTLELLEQ